jgi:hypothetical protein
VINRDTVHDIAVRSPVLDNAIDEAQTLGTHPDNGNCQDKEDVEMLKIHSGAVRGGRGKVGTPSKLRPLLCFLNSFSSVPSAPYQKQVNGMQSIFTVSDGRTVYEHYLSSK